MSIANASDKSTSIITVRNSLFAILGVLVLAAFAFAASGVLRAVQQRSAAEQILQSNSISEPLLELAQTLSLERTAASIATGAPDPISDSLKNTIAQNSKTGDELIAKARTRLAERSPFEGSDKLIKDMNEKYGLLKQARADASVEMSKPAADRDDGPGKLYVRALTDAIASSQKLRAMEGYESNRTDAVIAANRDLKHNLWVMSEFAGQEAAIFANYVAAGKPVPPLRIQILQIYRGRLEAAWDNARTLLASSLTPASLDGPMAAVQKKFFTDFDSAREDMYSAASTQEPYPMTTDAWMNISDEAAASLLQLADAAGRENTALAESNSRNATIALVFNLVLMAVAGAVGGASLWIVARRVVKPIQQLTDVMGSLADGKLDVEVVGVGRRDEIGAMAGSVQVFKDNAIAKIALDERLKREADERRRQEEEAALAKQKAEEEARQREEERERQAQAQRHKEMLQLADNFESAIMGVVDSLSSSAGEMERAAQSMAGIAEETSRQTMLVAKGTEQAANNIQMVASAAEELTSSVKEISGQVTQSSRAARNAVEETSKANDEIRGLVDAAHKIGNVVSLISDIAGQTNLLALNATIEAARAGDAGKGFAVVASEVKNLASQTAKATEEITSQVQGMQAATDKAVFALEGIAEIIKQIDETAVGIASAVEEQDASTHEIARNISEVATGTQEVNQNIGTVSHGAANTGSAAAQVLTAARTLAEQSDSLRQQVDNFLGQVRAA